MDDSKSSEACRSEVTAGVTSKSEVAEAKAVVYDLGLCQLQQVEGTQILNEDVPVWFDELFNFWHVSFTSLVICLLLGVSR